MTCEGESSWDGHFRRKPFKVMLRTKCPFLICREKNVENFIIYIRPTPLFLDSLDLHRAHTALELQRSERSRTRSPSSPASAKIESVDRKRKRPSSTTSSADPSAAKSGSLRDKHRAKAKMSSSAAAGASQVRASHILVKHEGSRRKASWKDPEGRAIRSTTRESAVSQLKALREDIVAGKAKFEDLASRFSDCSSAKRGGDLGPFGRGQMQKPFEEATYALKVGEISDIVDTDSGVHIIMRTG